MDHEPKDDSRFIIEEDREIDLYTLSAQFKHKQCGSKLTFTTHGLSDILFTCKCGKRISLTIGDEHLEDWQKHFYYTYERVIDISEETDIHKLVEETVGKTLCTFLRKASNEDKVRYYYGNETRFRPFSDGFS